jgi:hypothetical protein
MSERMAWLPSFEPVKKQPFAGFAGHSGGETLRKSEYKRRKGIEL